MLIENIPQSYIQGTNPDPELFVYDFKMTQDVVRTKVNLSMHMFSFLQVGRKQVHFADDAVDVNSSQSLLIKKGNSLWTELLDTEAIYYCRLLFFSEKMLSDFLQKHEISGQSKGEKAPYFIVENDSYISSYLDSLSTLLKAPTLLDNLLAIKFEELLVYLLNKYDLAFQSFLLSLVHTEVSTLKSIVESNLYANLKLEELAFLCHMSLSKFKRQFVHEYGESPGKWFQEKRLLKAKNLLKDGNLKSSDIYLELGYNNLSSFSAAFKNKFGVYPTEV